jgi:hypothetical protein
MDGGSIDGFVEIIGSNACKLHFLRSHPYAAIAEGFEKTDAEILG